MLGLHTHGNGSLLTRRCFDEIVGFSMEIEFLCATNVKTGEATMSIDGLWDAKGIPGEGPFLHGHGVSQPFSLDQMVSPRPLQKWVSLSILSKVWALTEKVEQTSMAGCGPRIPRYGSFYGCCLWRTGCRLINKMTLRE